MLDLAAARAAATTTARQLELLRQLAELAHGLAQRAGARRRAAGPPRPRLRRCGDAGPGRPGPRPPRRRARARARRARRRGVAARSPARRSQRPRDAARHRHRRDGARRADVDDDLLREVATDDADLARLRGPRRRARRSRCRSRHAARRSVRCRSSSVPRGAATRRADLEFAGLVQGRMAIMLDNTGLSRAAARSEAIMSAALDTLEEAVTMNGPDGATVYVNQAAVRLLGASSADEILNGAPGDDHGALFHLRRGRRPVRLPRPPRLPRDRGRGAPRAQARAQRRRSRPARSAGC